MAFNLLGFKQVVADMLTRFATQANVVTDLNVGSNVRTILESVAQEIDRLYTHVAVAVQEAIETLQYTTFSFEALPSQEAYGELTFTTPNTETLVIDQGTRCQVPDTTKFYITTDAATLVGPGSIIVNAIAESPGEIGNTSAGTITQIVSSLGSSAVTVTNALAFTTGKEAETVEERRQRFGAFLKGLHRPTFDGVEFGAKSSNLQDGFGNVTEAVIKAQVFEPVGGVAYISTKSTTAVTGGQINTVTPSDMTNIAVGVYIAVDTGSLFEYVRIIAVTGSTFDAYFAFSHTGTWKIAGCVVVYIDNGIPLYVNTTSTTAVTAGATNAVITPASMTGIVVDEYIQCSAGIQRETVQVKAVTGTTFTADFRYAKSGTWAIRSTASPDLVTRTQQIIDGYTDSLGVIIAGFKAAGIPCTIVRAERVVQDISLQVVLDANYTLDQVSETIEAVIEAIFDALDVGDPLYTDTIRAAVSTVEGVLYINTLTTPSSNVTPAIGQLIVLGVQTITST